MFYSILLKSALLLFCSPLITADDKFYKEMPKELRCSGCELTVKVLNQLLVHGGTSNLEFRVNDAISKVCDKERYDISEYNSERMAQVCDFMTKKHKPELKKELVKYFSRSKKSTYLELVQHICLDITRLCAGVSHKSKHGEQHNHEDGFLHFDTDSHDFTVVPGRNVRMPNPVHEQHDEL